MKSGAILLIEVPDFEKSLECCRKGDWDFVKNWGFPGIRLNKHSINNIDLTLENFTAMGFCAYQSIMVNSHPAQKWLREGCPPIPREQLTKAIHEMGVKEFSKFLNSQVPEDAQSREHVNAYTYDELKERLEKVGLTIVSISGEEVRPLINALGKYAEPAPWQFVCMSIAAIKK